eukprot:1176907-Prorocentrum_minimum.AAC.8
MSVIYLIWRAVTCVGSASRCEAWRTRFQFSRSQSTLLIDRAMRVFTLRTVGIGTPNPRWRFVKRCRALIWRNPGARFNGSSPMVKPPFRPMWHIT